MRILLAGARGAVGRRLVRRLKANQHEVLALTQSSASVPALKEIGAEPVIADALDDATVKVAVGRIRPNPVIAHRMDFRAAPATAARLARSCPSTSSLVGRGRWSWCRRRSAPPRGRRSVHTRRSSAYHFSHVDLRVWGRVATLHRPVPHQLCWARRRRRDQRLRTIRPDFLDSLRKPPFRWAGSDSQSLSIHRNGEYAHGGRQ
jgi:NADPH:quinone reductase-like Zn-dependent oxidoreductase